MSDKSSTKSSRRKAKKRPPVKLTVKIPSLQKKKRKIDYECDKEQEDSVCDVDDHAYASAECDFCSKVFGDRGKLLSHIRKSHRQKNHICMCHGREFSTRRSMQQHEEKTLDGTIGQRKNYRKYTHESLMKAFKAVKDGKMSTRKASKKYGIPFTTLLDRIAGRFQVNSFMASSGPRPLISRDDELKLRLHVQFMAAIGYTYLRSTITQLATELAIFKGVLPEGKALSDNWYRKFINRWPDMAKKSRGGSETYLASSDVVKKYFEEYVQVMKGHDLLKKPENIYCLTVYELNIQKLDQSQGKKKKLVNKGSDMVSIILCCNAAGSTMAPFMVFSGSSYTEKLLEGCLPNTQARVTATGEVDSLVFKDYFRNHLLKQLKNEEEGTTGPVLVMYNGHLIHFEMERIEWARKHGVLLFALPPQTSHLKNSLDSDMKDLFHQFFKQEAKKFKKKHFGDPLTKYNVCSVVSRVFPQVFTTRILVRFFKSSGVYPVSPDMLDSKVTYADVESFNDSVYDDLESTDAFLEVRLPFPNAANRVLQRRNEVPLLASPKQIEFPQQSGQIGSSPSKGQRKANPSEKNRKPRVDWNSRNFEVSVCEHSYVHGVGEVPSDDEGDVVSVRPTISMPHSHVIPGPRNQSSHTEITQTIDEAIGESVNMETVESVPVIETQVVSSVVEVGTTEEAPLILELGPLAPVVEDGPVEEVTVKKLGEYTGLDEITGQRYSFAVDPVTNIRYKIMFAE